MKGRKGKKYAQPPQFHSSLEEKEKGKIAFERVVQLLCCGAQCNRRIRSASSLAQCSIIVSASARSGKSVWSLMSCPPGQAEQEREQLPVVVQIVSTSTALVCGQRDAAPVSCSGAGLPPVAIIPSAAITLSGLFRLLHQKTLRCHHPAFASLDSWWQRF